jgi:hypothetical protein
MGKVIAAAAFALAGVLVLALSGAYYPYSCGCTSMSRRPQQQA